MRLLSTVAVLATVNVATCQFSGFNYGSTFTTGQPKAQADFEAEFRSAVGLKGPPTTFNAARLYTMVQGGTTNNPISAIPAAIATKTTLLLGLWASAGDAAFANELAALKKAIEQYGPQLSGLVAGISVGSEDLYRSSPTGQQNKENAGADPSTIVKYIGQVREVLAGTPLSGVSIGHVDTWTEWVNTGRNQAVINAVDWLGFDGYPYFETTAAGGNAIEQNKALFQSSVDATNAAAGGKPVWITETGFPVSGKTSGQAVPSVENARKYWEQVACSILGKMNVFWYTVQDAAPATPNPSFGILDTNGKQLYDLSCSNVNTSLSSSSSSSTRSATSSTDSSPQATSRADGSSATGATTSAAPSSSTAGSDNGNGSSRGSGGSQAVTTGTVQPSQTAGAGGSGSGPVSSGTSAPSSTVAPGAGASLRAGSFGAAFVAVLAAAFYF